MNNVYNSYFFNEFYQENGGGNYTDDKLWTPFFEMIADKIVEIFHPKTALDAGCACGYLVAALRDRGVEAYGIDISEYAIGKAREDIRPYLNVQSITDILPKEFPKKFDVVITIEVLEHLFPEEGKKAIDLLCTYSDTVIFTSTPTDIEDKTHVNVQQKEYWAKLFAENSYYRDLYLPVDFICPWAMLFRKREDFAKVIFEYELSNRVEAIKKQEEKVEKFKCYYCVEGQEYFTEESTKEIRYTASQEKLIVELREDKKITGLRLDPMECNCIIKHFHVYDLQNDREELAVKSMNGLVSKSRMVFGTSDPIIEVEVPENNGVIRLEIGFEIEYADYKLITDTYHMLSGEQKRGNKIKNETEAAVSALKAEIIDLQGKYALLQQEKILREQELENNIRKQEEEMTMLTEELIKKLEGYREAEVKIRETYEEGIQRLNARCQELENEKKEALLTQIEYLKEKEILSVRFEELLKQKKEYQDKVSELEQQLQNMKVEYEDYVIKSTEKVSEYEDIENELRKLLEDERCAFLEYKKDCSAHMDILEKQNKSSLLLIENEKHELENDLESYRQLYLDEMNRNAENKNQLEYYTHAYRQVLNSRFWRLTAPARKATDLLKKILKSNRVTYLFCKGLISLKRDGVKSTWRKVKNICGWNKKTSSIVEIGTIEEQKVEYVSGNNQDVAEDKKFSILVPLYNTPEVFLREMIQSVMNQTYSNWELCLADGSDEAHAYVETVVNELQQLDGRIKYARLEQNLGISENTNNCAKMATGDYIGFLDHDDLLAPNALYENAKAINETMADVLYSDEDHLSMQGEHVNPFFKPDWSPDLLYSQMYICHFTVIRHELFKDLGGFRSAFDGSQDYDLMLRLSEVTDRICHIPCVLYTWRECEGSTAANADAKPYAHTAGRNALDEHLKRKYGSLAHAEDSEYTFVFEPRFDNMTHKPLVSIIIPMKDKWELTDACIQSILKKSTYQNFEILILDNRSEEKQTKEWFRRIQKRDKRIRVVLADMEFNWSKLNNFGIAQSKGEVYIFLNNDTLIITPDWIERLCENALREDIGVVGALLLYEDDTIQHAGVVVGFGGWADHVFKGMSPVHYGAPFVSPMVSRNVLAVTGACMAISKRTIENIGLFDDEFIICGSDVEICVRAYERGLFNRYDANVRLYHLESKSRDSYIPEIDFQKSYECYTPYRENIDPFFNVNLDTNSVVPREKKADMNLINFKNFLKRCPLTAKAYEAVKRATMEPQSYNIPEIGPIHARKTIFSNGETRLNLLVPSVDKQHVFGGIATAINFFEELRKKLDCPARIITVDAPINPETSVAPNGYHIINSWEDSNKKRQLVAFSDRYEKTIPVAENDIFVATGWWTAYTIREVMHWQKETYGIELKPLIYLVQDYEPGFYPWSSRYMLADSTYRLDVPTWAVINSSLLREYFDRNDYHFEKVWHFEPVLNANLATILKQTQNVVNKKKQIIVYGRPSTERNAFTLVVAALQAWCAQQADAEEWTVYSAGEQHDDVELGKGVYLKSVGKLTIEQYANLMLETYAGISLMVSPHPSYPPLEMSTFGIKTITNCYGNKDLSNFNDNIISLKAAAPSNIAKHLKEICDGYAGNGHIVKEGAYVDRVDIFRDTIDEMTKLLQK